MDEAQTDAGGRAMPVSHLNGWDNPSIILQLVQQSHEGPFQWMTSTAFMAFFVFWPAPWGQELGLSMITARTMRKTRTTEVDQQKRSIQKYWDWRSLTYPWDADKSETIAETWETLLARLVSGPPGRRAIDMGTGTGQFAVYLARLGFRVTGIDISERMIQKAREHADRFNLDIDFQQQDAENLLFKDSTFDVVVSRNLLWTLPDPEKALEEWRRVLKPAGALVVSDGMWMNTTWKRVPHLAFKILKGMFRNGSMISLRFFCAYAGLQKRLPFYEGIYLAEAESLFRNARFKEIKSHDTSLFEMNPYGTRVSVQGRNPGFFVVQAKKY
jgi:ubiquinone/menaquinone biosynthesis C-methylase UbiE